MEKVERQTTDKRRATRLAPPLRRNAETHFSRANTCVSGPRRCKSCALTSRLPEKWLFDALCYQILALQICDRALYGSVVELPGIVSIGEAMTPHTRPQSSIFGVVDKTGHITPFIVD
ncbi:hypothetical protein ISCGN_015800 [Ixodes scapularis]